MKINTLLIICLVISLAACKKNRGPQPDRKLRSVTGLMTPIGAEQPFIADEEIYDENGRLISSVKGNIIYSTPSTFFPLFYTYQDGRLSETKDNGYERTEYLYNSNGQVSDMNTYYGVLSTDKILKRKEVYTYDNQGRKIKTVSYNYEPWPGRYSPPPSLEGHTYTFEYYANGLVSRIYDQSGTIINYTYDTRKNLTKVTHITSLRPNLEEEQERYTYQYDRSGKMTEVIKSDYSGAVHKITIIYDEEERIKTKIVSQDFGGGTYGDLSTINYTYTYF